MKRLRFSDSVRSGLTLLELLLAITIVTVLFVYLYGQFSLAQQSTEFITGKRILADNRQTAVELLYKDLYESEQFTITPGNRYDILQFSGESNSLHGLPKPYVAWMVVAGEEGNILVRVESPLPISTSTSAAGVYVDRVLEDIDYFRLLKSSNEPYVELFLSVKKHKDAHTKWFIPGKEN